MKPGNVEDEVRAKGLNLRNCAEAVQIGVEYGSSLVRISH